jgi:uncharacterized membrane protein YkgB
MDFCALIFAGFWNKTLGILRAIGSCFSFIATFTIIPFIPDGWAPSAGGFPAMTERVASLIKDLVLFAVSFYLLKQDVVRANYSAKPMTLLWKPTRQLECPTPYLNSTLDEMDNR